MKIEITKTGIGSRVFNDDGSEIQGLTSISIYASVDNPTRADLNLLFIDATAMIDDPRFIVGPYDDVVGLILKDGRIINLAEEKNERGPDENR